LEESRGHPAAKKIRQLLSRLVQAGPSKAFCQVKIASRGLARYMLIQGALHRFVRSNDAFEKSGC
jgi:hypothetical protein